MPLRTLADLPAELLLIIFEPLTTGTILNVGKTCQSLNLVALPVFLDRMGMVDPETLAIVRPGHAGYADKLTGLTINFGLIRIQQFVCILDNYEDNPSRPFGVLHSLTRNMRRLQQLFLRLSSVSRACIVFHSKWGKRNPQSNAFTEFLVAFSTLVDILLVKSCAAIQIVHPRIIELETIHTSTESSTVGHFIRNLFSPEDSYGQIPARRYRQRHRPALIPLPSPQTSHHSRLTRLEINIDFLFIPQLATFTLAVMKQSPIIYLALSGARNSVFEKLNIGKHTIPHIIVAVPQLQEIKLALGSDAIFPITLGHLARLPNLKTMSFGLTPYTSFEFPSRGLAFPELLSFTGSLDQATHLLGRIKTCPKLDFVNIVIDHQFTQPSWKMIVDSFHQLNRYLSVLGIIPRISLCLSNRGERLVYRPSADFLSASSKALSSISHLTLELPDFRNTDPRSRLEGQIHHVLGWVGLFSGLKYLTVTTRLHGLGGRETVDLDATLREAIIAECPQLFAVNAFNLCNAFHYHWSSAQDDLERGIDGIPSMNIPRNKAPMDSTYACYNF